MSESSELSGIEAKHRKERKELQAQIQALKKSIKGDKNKKKDLTAEIVRLESELENRQKEELDNVKPVDEEENVIEGPDVVNKCCKQKISKAQKRREKKSQQEKEREARIKIQEEENRNGPRNTESLAINTILKELNLKLHPIPSDGDCLYKAVSHQLETNRQKCISIDELRKSVALYIRNNKDDFVPFMSNPDTFEMLTDTEFEDYCNKIDTTKVWGGQLEIRALSNSLKCPIQIIQATGSTSLVQGEEFSGPPLVITYHRHMYLLGEHYNSTELIKEDIS